MLPAICKDAMPSSPLVMPVVSSIAIIRFTAARESAPRLLSIASGTTAIASQPCVSTITFFTVSRYMLVLLHVDLHQFILILPLN